MTRFARSLRSTEWRVSTSVLPRPNTPLHPAQVQIAVKTGGMTGCRNRGQNRAQMVAPELRRAIDSCAANPSLAPRPRNRSEWLGTNSMPGCPKAVGVISGFKPKDRPLRRVNPVPVVCPPILVMAVLVIGVCLAGVAPVVRFRLAYRRSPFSQSWLPARFAENCCATCPLRCFGARLMPWWASKHSLGGAEAHQTGQGGRGTGQTAH